jgi:uncharacterized membrane-anchored protein YitT (DUF2179 family)
MPKIKYKKQLKQIATEIVGSAFVAAAIYNFALNADFPMTGFSGISIILYHLFKLPIGFSSVILNIPVIFICYKLLGKRFLFSSVRCMLISSIFMKKPKKLWRP